MQEKESIISVRYGQTNLSLGSLFDIIGVTVRHHSAEPRDARVTVWHHTAEPCDAKTVTLGTDLSVRTSHSYQILIFFELNFLAQVRLGPLWAVTETRLMSEMLYVRKLDYTIDLNSEKQLAYQVL